MEGRRTLADEASQKRVKATDICQCETLKPRHEMGWNELDMCLTHGLKDPLCDFCMCVSYQHSDRALEITLNNHFYMYTWQFSTFIMIATL